MSNLMTVDVLSSIKGAKSSETISKLFEVIKNANISSNNISSKNIQNTVSLRIIFPGAPFPIILIIFPTKIPAFASFPD